MSGEARKFADRMANAWYTGVEQGNDMIAAKQELRVTIAKRVKALRTEKGVSQQDVSKAINANFLTYKGYENCKSDIPIYLLSRIADLFDTTVDYLIGRTDVKDVNSVEDRLKKLEDMLYRGESGK